MIEITQQSQDLPVSLSEQEVRQKVRAEWGSYSREFSGFPHTRLIFFNNMSLKFPHRLENPNDFMAMGLAVSGDKVPIPDENVGLHSPLYFSHPYRRFCATLAQTVNRLGLDENVKQAEVKKRGLDVRNPDPDVIAEIASAYYPIYEDMRVVGYSHYDIVE